MAPHKTPKTASKPDSTRQPAKKPHEIPTQALAEEDEESEHDSMKGENEEGIEGDVEDDGGEEEEEEEEEDAVTLPQKRKAAPKTRTKSPLIASFLPYLSHHILFFTRESPKTR
jgi:hypothetical protein